MQIFHPHRIYIIKYPLRIIRPSNEHKTTEYRSNNIQLYYTHFRSTWVSAQQAACVHFRALFIWQCFHHHLMPDVLIQLNCSWRKCWSLNIQSVFSIADIRNNFVFIFCLAFSSQIKKCTPEGTDISSTLSCYNGTNAVEGGQLLKEYGDVTNTIDLSFVPSIEINNVSSLWDFCEVKWFFWRKSGKFFI